jgi:hypothetical protein
VLICPWPTLRDVRAVLTHENLSLSRACIFAQSLEYGYSMRAAEPEAEGEQQNAEEEDDALPTIYFMCKNHNERPVYCSCEEPEGTQHDEPGYTFIQCSACMDWCHFICEGLPPDMDAEHVRARRRPARVRWRWAASASSQCAAAAARAPCRTCACGSLHHLFAGQQRLDQHVMRHCRPLRRDLATG